MLSWALSQSITLNGGYEMLNFYYQNEGRFVDKKSIRARMTGPVLSIGINF